MKFNVIAGAAREPEATEQGSTLIGTETYFNTGPFVHLSFVHLSFVHLSFIVVAERSKVQGIVVNFMDTTIQRTALLDCFNRLL